MFPFCFNQLSIPGIANNYMIAIMIFLSVFILGTGNIFLCFANRESSQGLHDILVKSLVIKGEWKPECEKYQASQKAVYIFTIVAIALVTANVFSASKILSNKDFQKMIEIQKKLVLLPEVNMAYVEIERPKKSDANKKDDKIILNIHIIYNKVLTDDKEKNTRLAEYLKETAMKSIPDDMKVKSTKVSIINFYDVGFFNYKTKKLIQIS